MRKHKSESIVMLRKELDEHITTPPLESTMSTTKITPKNQINVVYGYFKNIV